MPITRRQFDLGINDELERVMRSAHGFVVAHPGEAFSEDELASDLGIRDEASQLLFREGLWKMVEANILQARDVAGVTYFAPGRFTIDQVLSE